MLDNNADKKSGPHGPEEEVRRTVLYDWHCREAEEFQRCRSSLLPLSIGQLMSVSDSGQVMPPKSTWFEPKIRSGME